MNAHLSPGVAIVTGSAGGIGSAVAVALLDENPETLCAAVDLRPGHASGLIQQYSSHRVLEVLCDVARPESVSRAMEEIERWSTPVRSLVNCAGIQLACPSADFRPEDWKKVLDINLSGTFYWCQAAGRHMMAHEGGAMVNVSSVAEFFGWPLRVPYAAAKAGVSALTQDSGHRVGALGDPGQCRGARLHRYSPGQGGH